MSIKRIAHVCLAATDLAAAERFYCEGLGCAKIFSFKRDGREAGFYLQAAPGAYIEIFLRDRIEPVAHSPLQHVCLETDDLDSVRHRLIELGYPATEKKLGADQSWQMWTTDPNGVNIEFHQYTPRSAQRTRADCILS